MQKNIYIKSLIILNLSGYVENIIKYIEFF